MQLIHESHNVSLVIHGAASGADRLAGEWAKARGIECIACPAAWRVHGKAAGPIRNQYMLDTHRPDLVVAFPGGRGTADMVRRAMQSESAVYQPKNGTGPEQESAELCAETAPRRSAENR